MLICLQQPDQHAKLRLMVETNHLQDLVLKEPDTMRVLQLNQQLVVPAIIIPVAQTTMEILA